MVLGEWSYKKYYGIPLWSILGGLLVLALVSKKGKLKKVLKK
jgi:hypothetical protein|tara:strand:- start:1571 stop:1696 length:126 start_codon:yes stop_codon:yes gene_type:complete